MIFDLTANTNGRKLPTLDPNYPLDQTLTFIQGNANSVAFECRIAKDGRPTQYAYQWYLDGNPVSGATGSNCTLSGFTASGTHTVSCTVTNAAGTVQTRTAALNIVMYYTPTLDSSYPQNTTTVFIRGNTTVQSFEVLIAADGNPSEYSYQWYVNGYAISGATGRTFTWNSAASAGNHTVYCAVTNAAGTVNSRVATWTIVEYYTPTLNSSYPADVSKTFIKGNSVSATFEAKISTAGNPTSYTYQWYVDNAAVSGATGSSYTWTGSAAGTHTVYCKVTNSAGTVQTRVATLSVAMYYVPVLNSSYPTDATLTIGGSVTCNVSISTAGNPASYTYQWYKNGSAISGATSSSYQFTPSVGTTTLYCAVTNAAGTVTSRTATITTNRSYLIKDGVIDMTAHPHSQTNPNDNPNFTAINNDTYGGKPALRLPTGNGYAVTHRFANVTVPTGATVFQAEIYCIPSYKTNPRITIGGASVTINRGDNDYSLTNITASIDVSSISGNTGTLIVYCVGRAYHDNCYIGNAWFE